jgi:hypothetical protein
VKTPWGIVTGVLAVVLGLWVWACLTLENGVTETTRRDALCKATIETFLTSILAEDTTHAQILQAAPLLRPAVVYCVAENDTRETLQLMTDLESPDVGGDPLVQIIGDTETRLQVVRGRATRILALLVEARQN